MTGLWLTLAAGLAWAQAPDVDVAEEADFLFERAIVDYQAGRYADALEHLLASNRLAPNRNVVFNLARTWEKLGEPSQAYRAYVEFVASEPDPTRRAVGEDALVRLRPQVALVEVTSEPSGASVYVDRRDLGVRGQTPLTLALKPGEHAVVVEAVGHEALTWPVTAETGRSALVSVALVRRTGSLRLVGAPDGATVRVGDDAPHPADAPLRLPAGEAVLVVEAPGYEPTEVIVQVRPDDDRSVAVQLARQTGQLLVSADETGALIEVGGRPVGFTPAVLDLPVGRYEVVVTLAGHRAHREEVELVSRGLHTVEAALPSLQELSAASRRTEDSVSAPASVTVLTSRDLTAQGYQTLADALAGLRGLYLTDDQSYAALGVRGLSRPGDYGNRVLVTLDGHPLNDDQNGASYVGADLLPDLHDIEQIEVVRGPGSALYGSNAVLAVINLVTRREDAPAVSASLSADQRASARARVGFRLGDEAAGGWMSASGLLSDGARLDLAGLTPAQAAQADRAQAWGVRGKAWWRDLTVQAYVNAHRKRFGTGAFDTVAGDPLAAHRDVRGFVELRWEPSFTAGKVPLRFSGRLYGDVYRYAGDFPYVGSTASDRWTGAWVGLEPRLVIEAAPWLDLTVGAEARTSVYGRITGGDGETTWLDRRIGQQVVSGYVVADLRPTPWLRATLGGRYDHFTLDGVGGAFNPRVALVVQPTPADAVKLLFGTAFRAPSAYERFYNDGGLTQVEPDDLDPERTLTAEAEVSHRFGEVTTLSVGAFYTRATGFIELEDGPDGLVFGNAGDRVQTVGAEAELSRAWRKGWTIAGQASWQRTRVGSLIDGTPELNSPWLLMGLRFAAPVVPRLVQLGSRVVLDSPRQVDAAGQETPWAVVWDATLTGEIPDLPLGWSFGVRDLLDARRWHPVGPEIGAGVVPQPGRAVFLEIRVAARPKPVSPAVEPSPVDPA